MAFGIGECLVNAIEILDHAWAAGRRGVSWAAYTCYDAEFAAYIEEHDTLDTEDAIEAAFMGGHREHLSATWVHLWTTALADYDGFGTIVLDAGAWKGRELRHVLVDPGYVDWHRSRYGSGLGGCWEADPRAAEVEDEAKRERLRTENAARAAKRAEGLAWLSKLTREEIEAGALDVEDLEEEHGITRKDASEELKARKERSAAAERAASWKRCRAAFVDGATLIDHGTPGQRGIHGWLPGRPTRVYYDVRVHACTHPPCPDPPSPVDPGYAMVHGSGDDTAGSLEDVAARLASGRLTIATLDEVPPRPVVERVGHERFKEIVTFTSGSTRLWAATDRVGIVPLVLDSLGHKITRKAVVEEARLALRAREAARYGGTG
jgi:hypothetical protein